MREDTSKGDGGADQGIQLFVAADGELEMARRDTLDLEVLRSILWGGGAGLAQNSVATRQRDNTHPGKLKHLGGEVL